jgi:hypothetical protein
MAIAGVTVKASRSNAGYLYVGGSDVSAIKGFELGAGDSVSVDLDDLSKIWLDASQADQQYHWIIVATVNVP